MSRPPVPRSPLPIVPPNSNPSSWEWRVTQAIDDIQRRLASAQNDKFIHDAGADIAAYSATDARRFLFAIDDEELFYEANGQLYLIYPQAGTGGTLVTIEEVDGNPSIANVTKLQLPNGTVTEPSAGVARYTPTAPVLVDVTDGTTTVTDPPVLDFDPSYFDVTNSGGNAAVTFVGPSSAIDVTDGTTTVSPTDTIEFDPTYFDVTDEGSGNAGVTFVGPSSAIDVTDGTTTVSPTDTIEFDPAFFDVTDEGSGNAGVTFVGSSGGTDPWKESVRVASTANVALANGLENGDSIDGVTLATGDRVLLKNQTDAEENGIYVAVASGAASRSTDADTAGELHKGAIIYVREGTQNHDKIYQLVTDPTITLNTTELSFVEVGSHVYKSAFASLPTTGIIDGNVYLETDANKLNRATGTGLEQWGPIAPLPKIVEGDWTQSTSANIVAIFNNGNFSYLHTGVGGTAVRYYWRSIQSTPYTIICGFNYWLPAVGSAQMGIGWEESSSGKFVLNTFFHSGGNLNFCVQKMNSTSSFNSIYSQNIPAARWGPTTLLMRNRDDGTNLQCDVSFNMGATWQAVFPGATRTDFLSGGPDREVIFIDTTTTGSTTFMEVMGYQR